jgi:solute carrier family 13 (sodium-dependent dicarboxylate transporter), member 2/3/5
MLCVCKLSPPPPPNKIKTITTTTPQPLKHIGYALSVGFNESGLAAAIAGFVLPSHEEEDSDDDGGDGFLFILVTGVLLSAGLSNLVSNVATANIILPLLTCVSVKANSHPWLILIPATVACSIAFLFPVGV